MHSLIVERHAQVYVLNAKPFSIDIYGAGLGSGGHRCAGAVCDANSRCTGRCLDL